MKKCFKIIGVIFVIVVLVAGTLLSYLTVDEFRPLDVEDIEVKGNAYETVKTGESIRIMSWNLGYGALGDNADFFMDGGKMVYTATKDRVYTNLDNIAAEIDKIDPDILLTQETDLNSARSYHTNEVDYLTGKTSSKVMKGESAFATNFMVSYVPLPIPPIGKVHSGIATFSEFDIVSAKRLKLPSPFKWPLSTINLKRCLEVSRFSVEGTDKELVLINLHLEAYDSGEGKIAQANMLKEVIKEEADKGNYVIVGGDFNQVFSTTDTSGYPLREGIWQPGYIDVSDFGSGLNYYVDESAPSCRSLDSVLADAPSRDPHDFQYYVIDGFITTPNVKMQKIYTDDIGFVSSDHNPVIMDFFLE